MLETGSFSHGLSLHSTWWDPDELEACPIHVVTEKGIKLICVCMYVHACLWVCAVCTHTCEGQRTTFAVIIQGPPTLCFETGFLSSPWDLPSGLGWLASESQEFSCPPPHDGFVSVHRHAQLFHVGFRDQTQSLITVWQLLYQVRHFKSMLHFAFLNYFTLFLIKYVEGVTCMWVKVPAEVRDIGYPRS